MERHMFMIIIYSLIFTQYANLYYIYLSLYLQYLTDTKYWF